MQTIRKVSKHNTVCVCSILAGSFYYEWICQIHVYDLGENEYVYVYVFSTEMSGFTTKNVVFYKG